jgi:hypothetical protein
LEVVLAVGYRVKSPRGTQFRLKQAGGGDYFDELLARIRDIRSSERVFWRKVRDIYSIQ